MPRAVLLNAEFVKKQTALQQRMQEIRNREDLLGSLTAKVAAGASLAPRRLTPLIMYSNHTKCVHIYMHVYAYIHTPKHVQSTTALIFFAHAPQRRLRGTQNRRSEAEGMPQQQQ